MLTMFQRFDTNKDGQLSWEEIWASMKPLHKKIEQKVFKWQATPDMSVSALKNMIKEMFEAADASKDGVLVIDEFKQFTLYVLGSCQHLRLAEHNENMNEMFNRFDENKDGVLSLDEIWASMIPLHEKVKNKVLKWTCSPTMSISDFKNMIR